MNKTMKNEKVFMSNTELSCCVAYVIYMIVSSYMSYTCMGTRRMIDKCRMYYAMLSDETQIRMESCCIGFVEEELLPQLPEGFLNQGFKIRVRYIKKRKVQAIVFENDDCSLWMSAKPSSEPFFIVGVFINDEPGGVEQPAAA